MRGGVAYDTAAAPNNWQRVDYDSSARHTFAAGLAYDFSSMRLDLGGAYLHSPDRDVIDPGNDSEVDQHPSPGQPLQKPISQVYNPINYGHYESGYLIGSLGVTTWF